MQHRRFIVMWLFAIWMLCGISTAKAAPLANQPAAWRTTPTLSSDNCPSYQFRSTSAYAPIVGTTSYTSTTVYSPGATGPRRSSPWDDSETPPGGDPTGQGVGIINTPIGSPLVLLLMAVLYIFYTNRKKIHEKFAQFKKKQ